MQKYDIINGLAKRDGLRSYLEICTPTTGVAFGRVDREQLTTCDRLMYNCPAEWHETLPVTFRTEACSSVPFVRTAAELRQGAGYDIILVDGWHVYDCVSADLCGALRLLSAGGIIVAHDCDPRDPVLANPQYQPGGWCGVSYEAFIDFVLPRSAFKYYTVDADFGCGVVFTDPSRSGYAPRPGDRRELEFEWRALGSDHAARLAYYLAHRETLLNLISPAEFLAAEGIQLDSYSEEAVSLGVAGEVPLLPPRASA